MVDLIDRQELISWLSKDPLFPQVESFGLTSVIKSRPRIDAEPVRHGRWIVDEDGNIKCSECGHHGVGDNYCERCGAKMGA